MLRNYEREVKFYLEVASSVDVRVPQCHHGEWDPASGDFVLVLEDMTPAEQGDQVTGCDVPTAELAVRELARLHGPRWNDPTLDDLDWLTRRTRPGRRRAARGDVRRCSSRRSRRPTARI